jgi:NDP-sugar pyrophosphorylase family protein
LEKGNKEFFTSLMTRKGIILAGGKGSRIKKHLKSLPKPMIRVNGKFFLSYLVQSLCAHNIRKIYILCGYKANSIIKKYHKKIINFVPIICIQEKKPLGTGGCINQIIKKVTKEFIVINGDTFVDVDYSMIIKKKISRNQSAMLIKKKSTNVKSDKLNNLSINNSHINISKKGKYFNAGIYKFNKKIFKAIPRKFCSLENEIIKTQIENKNVIPILHKGFFLDIGSPESLKKSHNLLPKKITKNWDDFLVYLRTVSPATAANLEHGNLIEPIRLEMNPIVIKIAFPEKSCSLSADKSVLWIISKQISTFLE